MDTVEAKKYAASLYERLHEAVYLIKAEANPGAWMPKAHYCHQNVDIISKSLPEYKPVRGWFYYDLDFLLPYVFFTAHSVIETPKGQLVDFTPSEAVDNYPFLRANVSDEYFFSLEPYFEDGRNLLHYL